MVPPESVLIRVVVSFEVAKIVSLFLALSAIITPLETSHYPYELPIYLDNKRR